nr:hypothetical protein BaRGS_034075 [Batillaria attramentaria]
MPTAFVDEDYLLLEAVKAGREDKVRAFLSNGCRGDVVDSEGRTALHWACQYGHLPIACLLLSSATVNSPVPRRRDLQCTRCGANSRLKDDNEAYRSRLPSSTTDTSHHVINRNFESGDDNSIGDVKPVSCSCDAEDQYYCNVINRRDAKGQTPLHIACNFRREDVASFLATLPLCDVDARDKLGHTPLHRAIHANLETLACLLCDAGADVHATNSFRWTPLHEAARTGNENVIRALISRGSDVNAVTMNGMTPFLTAIFYYRIAQRSAYKTLDGVLRLLIEAGCRLSQGDTQWTPLSASIAIDNSFIASLLLYNGCRFDRQYRSYGRSLLVEAFARCEPFVAKLLVLCGYMPSPDEVEQCSRRIPSFSPIFLRLPVANAQSSMKDKYELLHWLRQRSRRVCSLMELSRTAVRLALNTASDDTPVLKRVTQLPLPSTIREYVSLSDFAQNLLL